jgi:hypothetical protein
MSTTARRAGIEHVQSFTALTAVIGCALDVRDAILDIEIVCDRTAPQFNDLMRRLVPHCIGASGAPPGGKRVSTALNFSYFTHPIGSTAFQPSIRERISFWRDGKQRLMVDC